MRCMLVLSVIACGEVASPTQELPSWIVVSAADVHDCPVPTGMRLEVRMLSEEVSRTMFATLGEQAPNDLPELEQTPSTIAVFANRWGARLGRPPSYRLENGFYVADRCALGLRLPTPTEWSSGLDPVVAAVDWCQLDNFADLSADLSTYSWPYTQRVSCDDGYDLVAPTRVFPPNAKGFRNLRGNAAEWVLRWHAVNDQGGAMSDDEILARLRRPPEHHQHGVSFVYADGSRATIPQDEVKLRIAGWEEGPCDSDCPRKVWISGGGWGFRLVQVNLVPGR